MVQLPEDCFLLFFFYDDNEVYTYITIYSCEIFLRVLRKEVDLSIETNTCGVFQRQQYRKVVENSDLIYFLSAILNFVPIEINCFASENALAHFRVLTVRDLVPKLTQEIEAKCIA